MFSIPVPSLDILQYRAVVDTLAEVLLVQSLPVYSLLDMAVELTALS